MKQVSLPSCQDAADLSGNVLVGNAEPSLSLSIVLSCGVVLDAHTCLFQRNLDRFNYLAAFS